METSPYPRVLVPNWADERVAFEMQLKGWLAARVETEKGKYYEVYFSDPLRLQQDMEEAIKNGAPCFTEPGLVILPEVTIETVEKAVRFLFKQGFFTYLRPDETEQLSNRNKLP